MILESVSEHGSRERWTELVVSPHDKSSVGGGKAQGLRRLSELLSKRDFPCNGVLKFQVPRWSVIDHSFFGEFCAENAIDLNDEVGRIQDDIVRGSFSRNLIHRIYGALSQHDLLRSSFAVRSSCNLEDSKELSFAGMFCSIMPVSIDDIESALKRCWSSFFAERITAYLTGHGLSVRDLRVNLVVQEFIPAERSGVIFTRWVSPNGEMTSLVVEGVYGAGEGLVGGYVDPDRFTWQRTSRHWETTLSSHREMVTASSAPDVIVKTVDADRRHQQVFSLEELDHLRDMASWMEEIRGYPLDMEFSLVGDTVYLLQERPITTLPPLTTLNREFVGGTTIWDNANISESFPGITMPLTFSHIQKAYTIVYEQFADVMGVPKSYIRDNKAVFGNMLGLIRGRVYYNLLNWYRLVFMFPNAQRSQSFMEGMMGVRDGLAGDSEAIESMFAGVKSPQNPWHRLRAVVLGAKQLLLAPRNIARFEQRMNVKLERSLARDFSKESLLSIWRFYESFFDEVIREWKPPIVNDTRCMLYHGFLKSAVKKWIGAANHEDICNQLTMQRGSLFSHRFASEIQGIVDDLYAKKISGLEWLQVNEPRTWFDLCQSQHRDLKSRVEQYLKEFGHRCADELKLESLDLTDTPNLLIQNIKATIEHSRNSKPANSGNPRYSGDPLAGLALGRWKKIVIRRLATSAATAINDRERLRYLRTKSFVVSKRVFRVVGQRFQEIGVLADANDVHWLTVDEVGDFILGRSVNGSLLAIAAERRREYKSYRDAAVPPDRFVTRGAIGAFIRYDSLMIHQCNKTVLGTSINEGESTDPSRILGQPCAPGITTGTAFVATSIAEATKAPGHILITERTDPGWVSVFPTCRGLIMERGSLLSHAAIVAREMGIPTIVGVTKATKRLITGQTLTMDGATGLITHHEGVKPVAADSVTRVGATQNDNGRKTSEPDRLTSIEVVRVEEDFERSERD